MEIDWFIDEFEKARQELGLKWSEVTEKCGITYTTVSNWRKRRAWPKLDTMILLLGAVGKKLEIVNI